MEAAANAHANPPPTRSRAKALLPLVALGASLARRGFLPVTAIVISAMTTLAMGVVAVVLARRGAHAPVHDVPILASSAIAWGGGFLLAFASSAHALRRDRTEGVQALFVLRTTSLRGYLVARIGGLAAVLAALVSGGTLVSGLFALAVSRASGIGSTIQATFAGIAFGVAFAIVIAPIAIAAVGARSRIGGYLFLAFVVMAPEALANGLSHVLPEAVTEVLSIPSALVALRSALAPSGFDLLRAVRAVVAIALFSTAGVLVVRRELAALERPEVDA